MDRITDALLALASKIKVWVAIWSAVRCLAFHIPSMVNNTHNSVGKLTLTPHSLS